MTKIKKFHISSHPRPMVFLELSWSPIVQYTHQYYSSLDLVADPNRTSRALLQFFKKSEIVSGCIPTCYFSEYIDVQRLYFTTVLDFFANDKITLHRTKYYISYIIELTGLQWSTVIYNDILFSKENNAYSFITGMGGPFNLRNLRT